MKFAKGGADFISKNPQHPPSLKVSPRILATLILEKCWYLKNYCHFFIVYFFTFISSKFQETAMLFTLLKFPQNNWKYIYQCFLQCKLKNFMLQQTLHTPMIDFAKQTSLCLTLMTLTQKFVEINNLVDCAKRNLEKVYSII